MRNPRLGMALLAIAGIGLYQWTKRGAAPGGTIPAAVPRLAARDVMSDPYMGSAFEPLDTNNAPNVSFEFLRQLAWMGTDNREATPNPRARLGLPGGIGYSLDYPLSGPGTRRL